MSAAPAIPADPAPRTVLVTGAARRLGRAIALPFGLISLLQTGRTWWDARFAVVVHHSPLRPAHILLILLAFYAILLSFAR